MKSSKIENYWGIHQIDDFRFFLEESKSHPMYCPIKRPECFCPHVTNAAEPIEHQFESGKIYATSKDFRIDGVEIKDDIYFFAAQGCLAFVKQRINTTNYVPLFIRDVRNFKGIDDFVNRLNAIVQTSVRPVVLVGGEIDFIPLPAFVEVF